MGLSKRNKKILDDATSTLQCCSIKIAISAYLNDEGQVECGGNGSMRTGRCHFCGSLGVIVDQFPRRGYGKQNYSMKWHLLGQEEDEN